MPHIGGPNMAKTIAPIARLLVDIVIKSDANGFVILPERWSVERIYAWIDRNSHLMRKFVGYTTTTKAIVRLSMTRIMQKRLMNSRLLS